MSSVAIKSFFCHLGIFENSSHWTVLPIYESILFEIQTTLHFGCCWRFFFFIKVLRESMCLMWVHLHTCHCSYFIVVTLSLNQWRQTQDDERFMSMNHPKIEINTHRKTRIKSISRVIKYLCEYTNDQKKNSTTNAWYTHTHYSF